MKEEVKVSVIVPVYNSEKYLDKCIQSILNQTYTNFELLLINDGSKDDSGVICDKYAVQDSRVRVIHQVNAGVSVARNKGLDNVIGKFITFIDSDDWVEPEYIATFFEENNNPTSCLVQQGHITIKGNNIQEREFVNKVYTIDEFSDLFYKEQLLRIMPYPWAKLYDAELIETHKIRFIKDIHYGEDLIFVLEYMKYIDHFVLNSRNLYTYIIEGKGLSYRINSYNSEISRFNILNEQIDFINSKFDLNDKAIEVNDSYLGRSLYRAISALYKDDLLPKEDKKEIIINLFTEKNISIINTSKSLGKTGGIFKLLFSNKRVKLIEIYFLFYFRYISIKHGIK